MKKYNFVYITTNLINGKQYIGEHSTDNINDNYLGSGNILKSSIKKYGKTNFNRQILEYFDNKDDAFNLQEKYINEYNTCKPNGYNISPKGGHGVRGCFSEKSIEKMRKANKGQIPWSKGRKNLWNHTEETKERMKKIHTGKKMSDESKEKNRIKHLKENLSLETIEKMKKSKSGKKRLWNHTEESKKKISDSGKGRTGYWKDKKLSPETIEKMKISGKGKNKGPMSEEHRLSIIEGIKRKKEEKRLSQASNGVL